MRSVFLLCLLVGCGGGSFQGATIDGVDGGAGAGGAAGAASAPDAGGAGGGESDAPSSRSDATADATSEAPSVVDVALPDVVADTTPGVDGGELGDARDEPQGCDLKPCMCSNVYVALCCNGPCPAGFEGLTCYCGQCRSPTRYNDAGRCE